MTLPSKMVIDSTREMMEAYLQHIQFNVRPENLSFYGDLFGFLGWKKLHEADGMLAVSAANGLSFWFIGAAKDVANDYDGPGVNHFGIGTKTQGEVDEAATYLRERGIELLFETPRHRPEFSGEGSTYYQVMFTTPDNILLEIVYAGPKA